MAHYKMKFFGSSKGKKSDLTRHFDKGQIIEAPEGEFDESVAERINPKKEVKESTEVAGKEVETSMRKRRGSKRGK